MNADSARQSTSGMNQPSATKESSKNIAGQGLEQAKRTAELLTRFESILSDAGMRQLDPPCDGVSEAEPSDFAWIVNATTRATRNNANRLGDLLDILQSELT